jgi:pyrroloquinoline quinone biosynthesis protein E
VIGLRRGVRLVFDPVRQTHALLYPEGTLLLDDVAADVLKAVDGRRDLDGIHRELSEVYEGVRTDDIADLLDDLVQRRLMTPDGAPATVFTCAGEPQPGALPIGMLAELTYRCPLQCTYCSNPVELSRYTAELNTETWLDVLEQARRLGVLQVHFSGGEPLLRRDLVDLIAFARELGLYTNLITSGIPLSAGRLQQIVDAGLDHLQLSIQDDRPVEADRMAGIPAYQRKINVAREAGVPLTINVVLHAGNVGRIGALADLAAGLGADRLELAHTQYYGWGLRNRATLLPSAEQVARANEAVAAVHEKHTMEIVYVEPDHVTGRPKPCMNGWGSRQFVVNPVGTVLPCLAADQLPGLRPVTVDDQPLRDIWFGSAAFNRFRGTDWLPEPCHSCALREVDFGGCRCQAYQLTGDPAVTDPACSLSPHHDRLALVGTGPLPERRHSERRLSERRLSERRLPGRRRR